MKRDKNSHKGQNGKVLVIGGNEDYHGAPILTALAAEQSGVDLVFPYLPPCHTQVARSYSLNFIAHSFLKTHLSTKDIKPILNLVEKVDTIIIGPGLGHHKETEKAVIHLLKEINKPTVIDAGALIYTNTLPPVSVLTPHRGEFKRLTGEEATDEAVQKWATHLGATIVCKGPRDVIANEHDIHINETGTPWMTVGGTGDVLAGLIGGLIAQNYPAIEACQTATFLLGRAGEIQAENHHGIQAHILTKMIPRMIHEYYHK